MADESEAPAGGQHSPRAEDIVKELAGTDDEAGRVVGAHAGCALMGALLIGRSTPCCQVDDPCPRDRRCAYPGATDPLSPLPRFGAEAVLDAARDYLDRCFRTQSYCSQPRTGASRSTASTGGDRVW